MLSNPTMGRSSTDGRQVADDLTKESSLKVEQYIELENAGISDTKRQYLQRGLSPEEADFLLSLSEKEESKIYRKVDVRLVPMLALLYLISHLDRSNIGNAKIEGLEEDLGMSGIDYNIAVFMFFISNILCALPSNYILGRFKRPSTYIGTLVISWGLVVLIGGFVKNLAGLATIRFFIGVFEAGFFPYVCPRSLGSLIIAKLMLAGLCGLLRSGIHLSVQAFVCRCSTSAQQPQEPSLVCWPPALHRWMALGAFEAGDGYLSWKALYLCLSE